MVIAVVMTSLPRCLRMPLAVSVELFLATAADHDVGPESRQNVSDAAADAAAAA